MIRRLFSSKQFIVGNEYPICKNCVNFIENPVYGSDITTYSKCKVFGDKNLVSGEITYRFASIIRDFDEYCGRKGKYYQETPKQK